MQINEAIAQILINFSNKYPLIAGVLIILFILRPVNKIGTALFHRKVDKSASVWNTKLAKIIHSRWYLRLIAWIVDTVFSVKIVSEKDKVIIQDGKHHTNKPLDTK